MSGRPAAAVADGWDPPGPGLRRYVVTFVYEQGGVEYGEEVDVNAPDSVEALRAACAYAEETLVAGYVRTTVEGPMVGLY